jgi:ferritin-like metal-binding protein YciE
MGLFSKHIETMDDLFVRGLQDIFYAEQQILKCLADMVDRASDGELKRCFADHLTQTHTHLERLHQVFRMHGREAVAIDCPAIDGIIEEADYVAGEVENARLLDAALIAAAQSVEHYEIARYEALVAWATHLGRHDCASLLAQTLHDVTAADAKLTSLANRYVNRRATA